VRVVIKLILKTVTVFKGKKLEKKKKKAEKCFLG
jgi:hypothetical protein